MQTNHNYYDLESPCCALNFTQGAKLIAQKSTPC